MARASAEKLPALGLVAVVVGDGLKVGRVEVRRMEREVRWGEGLRTPYYDLTQPDPSLDDDFDPSQGG